MIYFIIGLLIGALLMACNMYIQLKRRFRNACDEVDRLTRKHNREIRWLNGDVCLLQRTVTRLKEDKESLNKQIEYLRRRNRGVV